MEDNIKNRPGCLAGLLELFIVEKIFGWFQRKFGFGRGGCCGFGCGVILFIVFIGAVCTIICGIDWSHNGF